MFYNVYRLPQVQCIASYNDVDYFVVEEKNKFIVKPTFYADNIEYSYKNYLYKEETFDGTQNNAAIDTDTSKGLIKKEPKTRKSQLEAVKRYQQSKAEIRLRVSPEIKRIADAQAKYKGLSLTAYISQLIQEDAQSRAEEDFEQWKDMRQLEEDNGLNEPISLTALDVDIRDFDNIADAVAEAKKRSAEAYGI